MNNNDHEEYGQRYGETRHIRGERLANGDPFAGMPDEHNMRPPPPGNYYVLINQTTDYAAVRSQRWREGNQRTYRVHIPTALRSRMPRGARCCSCMDSRRTRLCKHAHAVRITLSTLDRGEQAPEGARVI